MSRLPIVAPIATLTVTLSVTRASRLEELSASGDPTGVIWDAGEDLGMLALLDVQGRRRSIQSAKGSTIILELKLVDFQARRL